ncbi:ABC transporter permease [Chryseolinea sp. H1M3-3]|uniref:ABC transporter permease n=1 Tax=Chryseolinea sp. H1M3-3 TaxID=3034144 RepID=UPI0023EB7655|nr:ABC transporter permease [Chryseolinea sp. H1M3-3]
MFKNYLTVALRNITRYKFYSAINILGMTIGLTACLIIILYIADELSYDKFHRNADRIYQVGLHGKIGGQDLMVANTCPPMGPALVAEIPEVESSLRVADYFGQPSIKFEEKVFAESKVFFVDSNFFEFFDYKLLEGDAKSVLKEPNTLVMTKEIATKYFGQESAIGKLVVVDNQNQTYKVTGVAENPPTNSHFDFNVLISAETGQRLKQKEWLNNNMYTYFLLREHAQLNGVYKKFEELVEKYIGPEVEKFMGTTLKQLREQGGEYGYYTTKLTDIHLRSVSIGDPQPKGNILYVYFFGGVGLFILVIACINFMNLSTARAAGRAKEVGLRKTLGSLREQMVGQFLAESMMYSLVAVVISLIACYFLLPSFNELSGKELGMMVFIQPWFIAAIIGLIIFVGFVAGSYPAFYLTSFNVVDVLKGKVRAGMKSKGVRSFLVVLQFSISIFLMIFTIVVYQQIKYMQEKNLGIDKENILILRNTYRLDKNKEAFRNTLSQQTGVLKMSYTNNNFPGVNNTTVFKEAGSEQDHIMGVYYADHDHQDVMKFEMKEGRFFSKEFPIDSMAIILNEAAVREFNFTNPIGEELLYNDGSSTGVKRLKIIGVMKNFNFESFKDEVRPLSILLTPNSNSLLIRYEGSANEIVNKVENLWKQHAANEPFEYAFLDESFDELFRSEQRMGQIFSIFAGLAIFVACLGLFALAAFTSEQRTKEIGIRKVMGASVPSLAVLLSKEFTKLVLIAFIPAAFAGWYISDQWLQGFAYRVPISPFVIILSGIMAIIIAWITVSFQSIKAATSNPVKSLRYE